MTHDRRVEGIVLAAGASRRARGCKALAQIDGVTFLARTVHVLEAGGCARVYAVIAEPHGEAITRALSDLVFVWNFRPELGMLSSLKAALAVTDADAVVVSLVDHPRVRPATVAALLDGWRACGASVVRPVYRGRRGHPYLVAGPALDALRAAPVTSNARDVLRSVASAADVEVDDPHVLEDLDTPARLSAVGASLPQGRIGSVIVRS